MLNCWWWGDSASEGGLAIFLWGGVMQKRECSYFRSPEVGILFFFFFGNFVTLFDLPQNKYNDKTRQLQKSK